MQSSEQHFGEWVRALRRGRDLTQEALAEQVNCAVATLRSIEAGRRRPSRELARLLADQLAVPPDARERFLQLARHTPQHPSAPSMPAPAPSMPAPVPERTVVVHHAPLIGRADDLAQLRADLRDPACRLVSIIGPGGIGKTSLALHLMRDLRPYYADGGLGIQFAGIPTPLDALSCIATVLGLASDDPSTHTSRICALLRPQERLLMLDNLEHLLDSPELIDLLSALISTAPKLKIIVTSRERLQLYGEWVYDLQGLPYQSAHTPDQPSAAEVLFLERARRVQHDFTLNGRNREAVRQICTLVAGHPLALELAATWLPVLTPAEIAKELERGLDLLATRERDIPARHRSMRAVFAHSWALLSPTQQVQLGRLSLFRGGFSREAATAIAQTDLHTLAVLIQKSFIQRNDDRYHMHELTRQYAAEQFDAVADETQTRMIAYYGDFVQAATRQFIQSGQRQAIDVITMELDNIRAALAAALALRQSSAGATLCLGLRPYWALRGLLREGMRWIEHFLALPDLTPATHGQLLGATIPLLRLLGEWQRAQLMAEQALALLPPGEYDMAREAIYTGAGLAALDAGHFSQAEAYLQQALRLDQMLGSQFYEAATLSNIGHVHLYAGDFAQSRHYYTAGFDLATRVGADLAAAHSTYALGLLDLLEGERTRGVRRLRQAVGVLYDFGYQVVLAHCLEALAAAAGLEQDHQQAGCYQGAAAALRETHQIVITPGISHVAHDLVQYARGSLDTAAWEAACANGRRMPLAEVVALARVAER